MCGVGYYGWSAKCGHVSPGCAPEFFAAGNIQRRKKRIFLHVGLDDHHVLIDDRGTGKAPLSLGDHVEPGIQLAEIFLP